jgi:MFS family permease
MDTFQGIGAIAGGVVAARLMRRVGELRLAGLGLLLFGAGVVLWLVPSLYVVLPAMAVAGMGIVWAIVALGTAYQRYSPAVLQGRVSAASNMLFSVPQTLSIGAGAVLITVVDYRIEIVAMGIVFVAAAGYLLTRRHEDAVEVEVDPALAA